MDYMITIAVIACFAYILYRKHKKKKQSAPDAGKVQTSELSPDFRGSGTVANTCIPAGSGQTSLTRYPDGSQAEIYVFDFRKYQDTVSLSSDIEAKLNRYLIDCQHMERTAYVRYVPVGTTLLVECVHTF